MNMQLSELQNGLADMVRHQSRIARTPSYVIRDDLFGMTDRDRVRFYRDTGKLAIWSGGSERTIFGSARTNYLFRAWHDWCHISSGVCNYAIGPLGCFEPSAEYKVADFQCNGLGDSLAKLVQAEVSGQARHFEATGNFVADQIAFTLSMM